MYTVETRIIGLKRLGLFLKKLSPEVEEEVDRNVISLCKPIEEQAKREAPVKTGALRASITTEHLAYLTGMVRDGVPYGIYQEVGFWHKWRTRGQVQWVQHPFLVPALHIRIPEVVQNLKNLVDAKLKLLKRK